MYKFISNPTGSIGNHTSSAGDSFDPHATLRLLTVQDNNLLIDKILDLAAGNKIVRFESKLQRDGFEALYHVIVDDHKLTRKRVDWGCNSCIVDRAKEMKPFVQHYRKKALKRKELFDELKKRNIKFNPKNSNELLIKLLEDGAA